MRSDDTPRGLKQFISSVAPLKHSTDKFRNKLDRFRRHRFGRVRGFVANELCCAKQVFEFLCIFLGNPFEYLDKLLKTFLKTPETQIA